MNDFPMGLTFVLLAMEDSEAAEPKRGPRRERELASAKPVASIEAARARRAATTPPPSRTKAA